jgi:hypothetical protein
MAGARRDKRTAVERTMSLLRRSCYEIAILVAAAGCANQTPPLPFSSSTETNAGKGGAHLQPRIIRGSSFDSAQDDTGLRSG